MMELNKKTSNKLRTSLIFTLTVTLATTGIVVVVVVVAVVIKGSSKDISSQCRV